MTIVGPVLKGEARDALVFAGSNMLNRLGALLLLPLYWTRLKPEDFGVLAVIAVIGGIDWVAMVSGVADVVER